MSQCYVQTVTCRDCKCKIDIYNHRAGRYPIRCKNCIKKRNYERFQKWYDTKGRLKLYLKRNKQQMRITCWMEIKN